MRKISNELNIKVFISVDGKTIVDKEVTTDSGCGVVFAMGERTKNSTEGPALIAGSAAITELLIDSLVEEQESDLQPEEPSLEGFLEYLEKSGKANVADKIRKGDGGISALDALFDRVNKSVRGRM